MTTNKELEAQCKNLDHRISKLASANSRLADEVHALKNNYGKLITDFNERLEEVHKQIFRK